MEQQEQQNLERRCDKLRRLMADTRKEMREWKKSDPVFHKDLEDMHKGCKLKVCELGKVLGCEPDDDNK